MPLHEPLECMSVDKLMRFQLKRLKEVIQRVRQSVTFYTMRFKTAGVTENDITELSDISHFGFTEKNDLREHYPFHLCSVPLDDIVRIHASSGTTGHPITGPYTTNDIEQWTECMARNFWAAGVRSHHIVQNAYGHGLFTGGLGFHQGASRLQCAVVPTSAGVTERQVRLIRDFKTDVICCTPSYALTIAECAKEMDISLSDLPLKIGIFGAEPFSLPMQREIELRMGIKAMEAYGLTELGGPGVAFSCKTQDGLHINEDHYLAEIVDPLTLKPLPIGETGELILTSLQREAMPLIRYRTKDITCLRREPCACGRTFIKMDKVFGRSDDMIIINGVNIFPSQIESHLLDVKEIEPQYRIIVRKKGYLDQLTVQVEAKKEIFNASDAIQKEVENKIIAHIKENMGIRIIADLLAPKSIVRSEGKALRVIDERPNAYV